MCGPERGASLDAWTGGVLGAKVTGVPSLRHGGRPAAGKEGHGEDVLVREEDEAPPDRLPLASRARPRRRELHVSPLVYCHFNQLRAELGGFPKSEVWLYFKCPFLWAAAPSAFPGPSQRPSSTGHRASRWEWEPGRPGAPGRRALGGSRRGSLPADPAPLGVRGPPESCLRREDPPSSRGADGLQKVAINWELWRL